MNLKIEMEVDPVSGRHNARFNGRRIDTVFSPGNGIWLWEKAFPGQHFESYAEAVNYRWGKYKPNVEFMDVYQDTAAAFYPIQGVARLQPTYVAHMYGCIVGYVWYDYNRNLWTTGITDAADHFHERPVMQAIRQHIEDTIQLPHIDTY